MTQKSSSPLGAIPKQNTLSHEFPRELVLMNTFTLWTSVTIYNSYLYFKENEKYLWEFPEGGKTSIENGLRRGISRDRMTLCIKKKVKISHLGLHCWNYSLLLHGQMGAGGLRVTISSTESCESYNFNMDGFHKQKRFVSALRNSIFTIVNVEAISDMNSDSLDS